MPYSTMVCFTFLFLYKDLDLPDAPRIKQLDEFLEGYYIFDIFLPYIHIVCMYFICIK